MSFDHGAARGADCEFPVDVVEGVDDGWAENHLHQAGKLK